MSDERDDSGSGRPPGSRRRRPPATIEGTASEVASEPMTNPTPETAAGPEPSPESISRSGGAEPPPHARPEAAPAEPAASSEPPRQTPPRPPSRGDVRPWIAAGIGGLIAAAAIATLLWLLNGYLNRDASLAGKVDALDAQVRGLAGKPAPADAKALDDLRARVDAIDAGMRRLDDRLNRAESALATPRSAPTDPAVLARLAAAESMQRALGDTIADLRKRIEDSTAAARDARERADAVAKSSGADANDALRKEVAALTGRLAALEHVERTTDQRIEQSMTGASADRAVRLAVAAGALRTAVERGASFSAELAAARALGADAVALAPLEGFAATGVPSADALARDFDKVEPAMATAAAPASHDGGVLGRLQA